MTWQSWQAGMIRSALIVGATAAAFATVLMATRRLGAESNLAVLAAVLTLTRARRPAGDAGARFSWVEMWRLPLIAILAAATAVLLHRYFALGAVLFIASLSLAAWLPVFGMRGRAFGTAMALPFIGVLIVPASPHARGGVLIDVLLIVMAAWVAHLYARLVEVVAARLLAQNPGSRSAAAQPKAGKISVFARMALQMASALLAAFVIGYFLFGAHWSWCVLTAYIVCAGTVSRGEAVYKGLLRLLGALAGTLAAALLQRFLVPEGAESAAVIFVSLFIGVWLREFNYAFWALCMTLIMATLQGVAGGSGPDELNVRLLAIVAGALCAIAAAWLLMPIRTRAYAGRVLADTLAAFDHSLRSNYPGGEEAVAHCLARLERVAPALRLHCWVIRAKPDSDHPAFWVAPARSCSKCLARFTGDKAALIRAIGLARRTLAGRDGAVYAALASLEQLARGGEPRA